MANLYQSAAAITQQVSDLYLGSLPRAHRQSFFTELAFQFETFLNQNQVPANGVNVTNGAKFDKWLSRALDLILGAQDDPEIVDGVMAVGRLRELVVERFDTSCGIAEQDSEQKVKMLKYVTHFISKKIALLSFGLREIQENSAIFPYFRNLSRFNLGGVKIGLENGDLGSACYGLDMMLAELADLRDVTREPVSSTLFSRKLEIYPLSVDTQQKDEWRNLEGPEISFFTMSPTERQSIAQGFELIPKQAWRLLDDLGVNLEWYRRRESLGGLDLLGPRLPTAFPWTTTFLEDFQSAALRHPDFYSWVEQGKFKPLLAIQIENSATVLRDYAALIKEFKAATDFYSDGLIKPERSSDDARKVAKLSNQILRMSAIRAVKEF